VIRWAADAAAAAVLALTVVWLTLPDPEDLSEGWPETTAFMELRERQARASGEAFRLRHRPVPLAVIPDHLERAVRVAEDAMFYRHHGVDWHEVRAAVREWWRREERPRGASTLTMQLARNLYLSPDRSWRRKFREVLLAYRMELRLPKRRILELYLNLVELGDGVFGVEAAARHYWGIPVSRLDRRHAAELAATLPSPRTDNPATRTAEFRWRAELIRRRAFRTPDGEAAEPPGAGSAGDSLPAAPVESPRAETVAPDSLPADTTPRDTALADPVAPDTVTVDTVPPETDTIGAAGHVR